MRQLDKSWYNHYVLAKTTLAETSLGQSNLGLQISFRFAETRSDNSAGSAVNHGVM